MFTRIPFVFIALCVLVMAACGRDGDRPAGLNLSDAPLLQLATPTQVREGKVAPASYIVAFRDLVPRTAGPLGERALGVRQHALAFEAPWIQRAIRQAPRFLSTMNLSFPGRTFASPRTSLRPMPLLHEQLPVEDSMASLVEVNFPSPEEAASTLRTWMDEGRIWYAEPNVKQDLKGDIEDNLVKTFKDKTDTPWLTQVSWVEAIQKLATVEGKAQPIIAVMDSGVDVLHENLKDAIYINETGANKLCRNDYYGCNTTKAQKEVLGDGNVYPTGTQDYDQACPPQSENCQHGTHVAGIIGARGSETFVGMCPYCKILVVKVVEIEKNGDKESFAIKDSSILAGLAYVSGFKVGGEPLVRVINASFGKFERSRSVELFIRSLKNFGRGTLVVAAAGNEDTMKRQYPAAFEDVLAVSNVLSDTLAPEKSPSSNFGMWVDIAAPGDGECKFSSQGIDSTIPGGGSDCKRGTSMASPIVAGIAGLVLTQEPNLTASALEARLRDTAIPDYLYQDGVNNGYRPNVQGAGLVPLLGGGVVNALAAVDPTLDKSPPLLTQRSDRVRSGCGILGSTEASGSAQQVGWILLFLPVFLSLRGLRKHE